MQRNVLVVMINKMMSPSPSDPPQGGGTLREREREENKGMWEGGGTDSVVKGDRKVGK